MTAGGAIENAEVRTEGARCTAWSRWNGDGPGGRGEAWLREKPARFACCTDPAMACESMLNISIAVNTKAR